MKIVKLQFIALLLFLIVTCTSKAMSYDDPFSPSLGQVNLSKASSVALKPGQELIVDGSFSGNAVGGELVIHVSGQQSPLYNLHHSRGAVETIKWRYTNPNPVTVYVEVWRYHGIYIPGVNVPPGWDQDIMGANVTLSDVGRNSMGITYGDNGDPARFSHVNLTLSCGLMGWVKPKYAVVTVIYAPPGANGGHGGSKVVYGHSLTTASTTTIAHTFSHENEITAGVSYGGGKTIGVDASGTMQFGYSDIDSDSVQMTKTTTTSLERDGPGHDGVDHDEDEIWLWLNPKINMTLIGTSGLWDLSKEEAPIVKFVLVGWLDGHYPIPPGDQAWLNHFEITTNDFQTILSRDPLALSEDSLTNSNRYIELQPPFEYEPPLESTDPPTALQAYSGQTSSGQSHISERDNDYNVSFSISGSIPFASAFKATVKDKESWTWATKDTSTLSSAIAVNNGITIGGPAFGYTGATSVHVYYDTFFQTYAFALKTF